MLSDPVRAKFIANKSDIDSVSYRAGIRAAEMMKDILAHDLPYPHSDRTFAAGGRFEIRMTIINHDLAAKNWF